MSARSVFTCLRSLLVCVLVLTLVFMACMSVARIHAQEPSLQGPANQAASPTEAPEPVDTSAGLVPDSNQAATNEPSATLPPASTPPPATPPETQPPSVAPVVEAVSRRDELEKQLASLKSLLKTLSTRAEQRKTEVATLEAEIEKFRREGFPEEGPYPLSELDALRDQMETELLAKQIHEATLASHGEAVEAARKQFDIKETARRLAKEALASAKDDASRALREENLKLAEQESKVAEAIVDLRKAEAEDESQALAFQQKKIDFLAEKMEVLQNQVTFTQAELNQRLAELAQQEADTQAEIHSVTLRQWVPEDNWQETQQRLAKAEDPAQREVLAEELEAWRLARKQLQEELLVLNRRLQVMTYIRETWQRRYELYHGEPSAAERTLWREETAATLKELAGDAQVRAAQTEQARNLATTLQTKIETANGASAEKMRWLNAQQSHLSDMLRTYGRSKLYLERAKRLHERLLNELNAGAESISIWQWLAGTYQQLLTVWNHELGVVDDRSITVRKIVIGILIMVFGFWAASFSSGVVERRLSNKNLINKDTAAVFRTLMFYSLLVLVILTALWSVNVPVTVFTFLGGALAIGFGLGSQNLVNNFLSGLVIITERPVRLGERIVFGSYDGFVEEVGYRCTKLRTLTGHLVTIPNSQLINEQVENIQRRPYIRRSLNITIPYSTSRLKVQQAVDVVKAILGEEGIREPIHPTISGEYMQPRVHFSDYNPDSLNLWVMYWFSPPWFWDYMEHTERVNFRIMEEFERIEVEFAFPTQKLYVENEVPKSSEPA